MQHRQYVKQCTMKNHKMSCYLIHLLPAINVLVWAYFWPNSHRCGEHFLYYFTWWKTFVFSTS